jgi:hypothetical protein
MMKAVCSIALILLTAACLPLTPAPPAPPVVDNAGTAEAMLKTAIVQTLTAQPTGTLLPPVSSATSIPEILSSETETLTANQVVDPLLVAATGTFEIITSTAVPATFPAGSATTTRTPAVLTYGTLPPAVPFARITLVNRAKTQAYISLQVVTAEGGPTIMEYPVHGRIKIEAPVGQYLYVAWIGGRKMVGEFRLHQEDDLELLLYRDRIEVK